MGAVLGVVGLALGAVGTGLNYFAQRSAASTEATFSALNATAQSQAATQNASLQAAQSDLQATQANTQAQAAAETAQSQREQADIDAKAQQEEIRRQRDASNAAIGQANAQAGASGAVVATGSPLEVLLAAADQENQQEAFGQYDINARRAAGYRGAAATALGGQVQSANAQLYGLQSLEAIQRGREEAAQARLGGLAGAARATGMRNTATGSLFSGIGGGINSFANSSLNPWKPRKY